MCKSTSDFEISMYSTLIRTGGHTLEKHILDLCNADASTIIMKCIYFLQISFLSNFSHCQFSPYM